MNDKRLRKWLGIPNLPPEVERQILIKGWLAMFGGLAFLAGLLCILEWLG